MIDMFAEWPSASDMMTADPVTVEPGETLSVVLGLMRSNRIHEVPVRSRGKVVGLLAYYTIGHRYNLSLTTKVQNLMSIAPTVYPRTPFPEIAEKLLDSDARAACVVDPRQGTLLGIVSRTDLTKAVEKLPQIANNPAMASMTPITTIFHENDKCGSLFSAIKTLEDHPLPVLDSKNRLVGSVGILEMGDAFWRPMGHGHKDFGGSEHPANYVSLSSIMRPSPPTVDQGAIIGDCARLMSHQGTYSVFVVGDERPIGVVSQTDVLTLALRLKSSTEGAYVQLSGLGPGTDPSLLSDLDRVLTGGLKRIAHMENPLMLTLHFTPHSSRRLTDNSVQARLHTEGGHVYSATRTDWNLLNSVADLMSELERQVRKDKTITKTRTHRVSTRLMPTSSTETSGVDELEDRLRTTLTERSHPRKKKDTRRT
jgi:CBS domain-containing protein/ribosome-associated translation inhibitor RaiA